MKILQLILMILLISTLPVTISSCSKVEVTKPSAANEDPTGSMYVVNIQGMKFQPDTLYALPGHLIKWKNLDAVEHSVVSDDGTSFNSGAINPGATFTFITSNNNVYPYHCAIHPAERAVLSVVTR